ncbi:MAG: HdeD family acid-resistance protein [Bacilli bacterium]
MEEIKKSFNKIWYGEFASSILFAIIGILLIVWPEQIISMISTIIGIAIIILGIFGILRYFRNNEKTFNFDLMYGIICVIAGALIVTNTKVVASFLPVIIGIWMIGNSVIKIQYAMTLKDYNSNNWLTIMIVSVLTLACGILFVFNPFKGATLLTQTLGIALLAYAVVDIVNSCILKKNMKKFSKQVKKDIKEFKEAVYEEVEEEAPKKKTQTKKKTTSKKSTSTKKKSTNKKD